MASRCRSTSAVDARVPMRATFANLYGPETDAEFVKSVARGKQRQHGRRCVPVVDTYSCRQMYLRSYTFSAKKESLLERIKKRVERIKVGGGKEEKNKMGREVVVGVGGRWRKGPCDALFAAFRKLLVCSVAGVDVEEEEARPARRTRRKEEVW